MWAATESGGLSRIKDGRIATLTTENGLPCNTINATIEDGDGSLWLYTACGLLRITRTELDAWIADPEHKVETTVWTAADGVRLRSSAASEYGPRVAKSRDGKLWFVTGEGIQVIDPHHLAFNSVPPPVHIEQIIADSRVQWQHSPGAAVSHLRLQPRIRDLTITYNALSFVAPEKIHFKYKLEGQDSDWREVINDRDVQYSNLRPGWYRFRLIASNNSGVWNEQGDTLEFSVAPAYYQTNWFRALCAGVLLFFLWAAYQYRLRRLHREFEMTLEARVGERTRIARDLHDTLLQSFHGLLLRFQTVSQLLLEHPLEAKKKLESAIEQAADAITEGRDAVQGLRDSTVQGNDLAQAISALGGELGHLANPRPAFHVAVEGEPRNLHPILRDETYKIAAEALRNAFRHSKAQRVEVEIRYDSGQFRFRVRDDGKGMDPAILSRQKSDGHYGLPGMRERATLVGAKLTVWSEVDSGTEVELRVPASAAYATKIRSSWWARKFADRA
jgi:signal transduction histidine kinase